ncbi:MAG: DUF4097 family beta strand repeat-containing protein [Acidobacteriota bacterium]|jgi:DUF4097 and DUF4098 domain-containing protein YvlB
MGLRSSVIALACLAAVPWSFATGQQQVDRRAEVAPDTRVEISNFAGTVRVTGWDRNEVRVQGTLGEGASGLGFDAESDEVQIEVEWPRRRRNEPRAESGESFLEISVPRGATLELEALAASIVVDGVEGEVRIETSAGDITYGGGARRIEADTAAGDIEIDSSATGAVIDAESLAGEVLVQFVDADVSITTVTGDARAIGGRLIEGDFESTSGTFYFEGEIAAGADVGIENFNGDVELLIPEDTAADFDISTYSGSIETEFGYQGQPGEEFTPEQHAEFTLGVGGASVDIETFAGRVAIRRR